MSFTSLFHIVDNALARDGKLYPVSCKVAILTDSLLSASAGIVPLYIVLNSHTYLNRRAPTFFVH